MGGGGDGEGTSLVTSDSCRSSSRASFLIFLSSSSAFTEEEMVVQFTLEADFLEVASDRGGAARGEGELVEVDLGGSGLIGRSTGVEATGEGIKLELGLWVDREDRDCSAMDAGLATDDDVEGGRAGAVEREGARISCET